MKSKTPMMVGACVFVFVFLTSIKEPLAAAVRAVILGGFCWLFARDRYLKQQKRIEKERQEKDQSPE